MMLDLVAFILREQTLGIKAKGTVNRTATIKDTMSGASSLKASYQLDTVQCF